MISVCSRFAVIQQYIAGYCRVYFCNQKKEMSLRLTVSSSVLFLDLFSVLPSGSLTCGYITQDQIILHEHMNTLISQYLYGIWWKQWGLIQAPLTPLLSSLSIGPALLRTQEVPTWNPFMKIFFYLTDKNMNRGRSGLSTWKYQFSYDH